MKFGRLALFGLFSALGTSVYAENPELKKLLEQIKKSEPACKAYAQSLDKFSVVDESGDHLKNPNTVPQILKWFDPKTPESIPGREIYRHVAEHIDPMTEEDLVGVLFHFEGCGYTVQEYRLLKGLMGTVSVPSTKKAEKEQTRRVVQTFLEDRTKVPGSLIEVETYRELLKRLYEGGFVPMAPDTKAKLEKFSERAEVVKNTVRSEHRGLPPFTKEAEFQKLKPVDRERILKTFKHEVKLTVDLNKDLRALVEALPKS